MPWKFTTPQLIKQYWWKYYFKTFILTNSIISLLIEYDPNRTEVGQAMSVLLKTRTIGIDLKSEKRLHCSEGVHTVRKRFDFHYTYTFINGKAPAILLMRVGYTHHSPYAPNCNHQKCIIFMKSEWEKLRGKISQNPLDLDGRLYIPVYRNQCVISSRLSQQLFTFQPQRIING